MGLIPQMRVKIDQRETHHVDFPIFPPHNSVFFVRVASHPGFFIFEHMNLTKTMKLQEKSAESTAVDGS